MTKTFQGFVVDERGQPTDEMVVAQCDLIPGNSWILGFDADGSPNWGGETKMIWDGQETDTINGFTRYWTDHDREVTGDQVMLCEVEEHNQGVPLEGGERRRLETTPKLWHVAAHDADGNCLRCVSRVPIDAISGVALVLIEDFPGAEISRELMDKWELEETS